MRNPATLEPPALQDAPVDLTREFRAAMRRQASTVAILTAAPDGERYGMVATAVMSMSMDPPSMAVAVNRQASIHPALLACGLFRINLLQEDQAEMCQGFARMAGDARFGWGDWLQSDRDDPPRLASAQASILCRTETVTEFGSHSLFIGSVRDVTTIQRVAPLLYLDGGYRRTGGAA